MTVVYGKEKACDQTVLSANRKIPYTWTWLPAWRTVQIPSRGQFTMIGKPRRYTVTDYGLCTANVASTQAREGLPVINIRITVSGAVICGGSAPLSQICSKIDSPAEEREQLDRTLSSVVEAGAQ